MGNDIQLQKYPVTFVQAIVHADFFGKLFCPGSFVTRSFFSSKVSSIVLEDTAALAAKIVTEWYENTQIHKIKIRVRFPVKFMYFGSFLILASMGGWRQIIHCGMFLLALYKA